MQTSTSNSNTKQLVYKSWAWMTSLSFHQILDWFIYSIGGVLLLYKFFSTPRKGLSLSLSELLTLLLTYHIGTNVARSLGHLGSSYPKHIELLYNLFSSYEDHFSKCVASIYSVEYDKDESRERHYSLHRDLSNMTERIISTIDKFYPELDANIQQLRSYTTQIWELASLYQENKKTNKQESINYNIEKCHSDTKTWITFQKADLLNHSFERKIKFR